MLKIIISSVATSIRKNFFLRNNLLVLGCLFTLLCVFYTVGVGQQGADLSKPFKKCGDLRAENGALRMVASDNDNTIILSDDRFLILIDPKPFSENWRTEINGKLEGTPIFDKKRLYYISSIVDDKRSSEFVLNSLSLETGLVVWQRKLLFKLELKGFDEEFLFMSGSNNTISGVRKADGDFVWSRNFSERVLGVSSLPLNEVSVLLENSLLRISAKTGEEIQKRQNLAKGLTSWFIEESYFVAGSASGEISKFGTRENSLIWKIRVGGNVSNLEVWKDLVVASSYDNFIYCFSLKSGKLIWKKRVGGRISAKPSIYSDFVVIVSTGENNAFILDIKTGKVVNQILIEDNNIFVGVPKLFEGVILFQTLKGLYIFGSQGC